jgi:hypothetical protein
MFRDDVWIVVAEIEKIDHQSHGFGIILGYGFIAMAGRFELNDPGVALLYADQLDVYRFLTWRLPSICRSRKPS